SVTKTGGPAGVHVGWAITPAASRSTLPASGESAGQRSSAQWPFALRVPATQRPSGDGTTSPQVAPAPPPSGAGGTGSAGRFPPGTSAITDSLPPPTRGPPTLAPW